MRELTFFLGLQVKQKEDGIFISQDKYVNEILNKFGFFDVETTSTHMETNKILLKDEKGEDVDEHLASLDRKSIKGGCQFLGCSLILWQCKKQTMVANSTTEVEYVAASSCYGQVLWIHYQLLDYGYNFMQNMIHIDNESTICIVKNPVFHSKTKHIEIRHHFIKDSNEMKLIQMVKIHTDKNVAYMLTKAFDIIDFLYATPIKYALTLNTTVYTSCIEQFWANAKAKNINGEAQIHAKVDGKKVIISEATIKRDLKFEDEGGVDCLLNEVMFEQLTLMDEALNKGNVPTQSNDPPLSRVNTLKSREDRLKLNELMELCTKLSERVLNLETTKTAQAKEISSLKKRVKRLEKKKRSGTHMLKRLYKVGLSARVESFAEEQSLGKEDASKQGRNIADIDTDAEITLVDETAEDQGKFDDQDMFDTSVLDDEEEVLFKEDQDVQNVVEKVIEDITTAGIEETVSTAAPITIVDVTPDELTMAQALVETKKLKPKGDKVVIEQEPEQRETTTTTVTIPTPDSTRPKARGVVMQEPMVKDKTALTQKSSSKRAGDELDQERSKKQKVEDDKESEELKRCLEIIPDDRDDVTIDAIPLSIKTPIIDYKIYKERKKSYFQISKQMEIHRFSADSTKLMLPVEESTADAS
uniref:Uncharacterized protein n=1 Tax=Tanacetum cinerariifolium TaxID=118510 RepID=A0A699GJ59_TANCI|nr:hypothetical protein [Tanacetum cinerariifolium]